ncbi:MAG: ATP-binding protein [Ignavibacteriae bacterium]|nr:MAG: ATP-binding protein [Ignavibacteriota bacterium]
MTITAQPAVIGEWDKFRLEQVVTNLLSNAMKFGLGKPIEISVSTSGGRARLSVLDHGIGIDPQHQSKIFETFYRVTTGLTNNIKGSGLGLALVKHILDAHGGSITLTSAAGKGCTIRLLFPTLRERDNQTKGNS